MVKINDNSKTIIVYLLISSIVNGLGYEDSINSRNLVCEMSKFIVGPLNKYIMVLYRWQYIFKHYIITGVVCNEFDNWCKIIILNTL